MKLCVYSIDGLAIMGQLDCVYTIINDTLSAIATA